MKHLFLILTLTILIKPDTYISAEVQRKTWINSLIEGTYLNDDGSTIINKESNGNISIERTYQDSFCITEYDSIGNFVMSSSGIILTSSSNKGE